MLNAKKIGKNELNKIALDWKRYSPRLVLWNNNCLLLKFGPVLVGICFEVSKSKTQYTPVMHYHASPLRLVLLVYR